MSFLLDANALIALCWQPHEHHDRMRNWFKRHADQGWSTCALTQGALVRIVSQPAFAGRALAIADVAELLLRNTAHPKHRLLALDFDFAQVMAACTGNLVGHRQISDGWLLAAAMRNSAKLLTFDTAISALLATEAERKAHLAIP